MLFADHVPSETAEAVRRLEAAGWIDVGKANLHEFAYGTTSENPHFGTVPNPLAPGRIAGGSSGGSAAALGGAFLWLAWRLRHERTPARARLLFHYSLAYLALLFVAMALDTVLG